MRERVQGEPGRSVRMPAALAVLLVLMSFFQAVPEARAESARAAYVAEVSGNVQYKKAGGSKTFRVYKDLNLNQGDYLYTGADSYAILRVGQSEVEFTVAANTEIYMAELTEGAGNKTRVKSWAGSLWSKVKSLVSSEDEVELETPTAVMGVRGTQFATFIDPQTGETVMLVAAGKVTATTVSSEPGAQGGIGEGTPTEQTAMIYPSQQIELQSQTLPDDLRTAVEYADVARIVGLADPKVLETFLRNAGQIQQENEAIKQKLKEQFDRGTARPDPQSIVKFETDGDLLGVLRNFDALLPNIAKEAVDRAKIEAGLIDEVNRSLPEGGKKLDLSQVPPLDKTAGLDPEIEKKKAGLSGKGTASAEDELLRKNRERLKEVLKKAEEQRKALEEANRRTERELAEKALGDLRKKLDAAAREAFEQNRVKNESGISKPAPDPVQDSGSDSNSDSGKGSETPPPVGPHVKVTQLAGAGPGSVRLRIEMEGFTADMPFYAVEAHLSSAGDKLNYAGTENDGLQDTPSTVFDGEQTAEMLRQTEGSGQREWIYAGTLFQRSGSEASAPVRLNGAPALLVDLPLETSGMKPGETAQVELFHFKALKASGETVYELNAPVSLTVTAP
ncbi:MULTISPECIES: FecR family protein [Paenibacillus]|uniref:FecR family protein n=1 Tax=Paenibacillus TaxID=44249 RepID=UPI0022B92749|nr:FecR domain-containing protein [Paenibacillus caseinilyticus]MCZ8518012.1 FecR domain-containing protein [Paenibacillus caseinilyticus]